MGLGAAGGWTAAGRTQGTEEGLLPLQLPAPCLAHPGLLPARLTLPLLLRVAWVACRWHCRWVVPVGPPAWRDGVWCKPQLPAGAGRPQQVLAGRAQREGALHATHTHPPHDKAEVAGGRAWWVNGQVPRDEERCRVGRYLHVRAQDLYTSTYLQHTSASCFRMIVCP